VRADLRVLAQLRWAEIGFQLVTVLAVRYLFGVEIPVGLLLAAIGFLALVNGATFLRLAQAWPVSERELFFQTLVDVAVLTYLLFFTGGAVNPFVFCFLLFILYAVTALPPRLTWALTAVCVLCYGLLHLFNEPLRLPADPRVDRELDYAAHGMIYVLTALLGTWLGIRAVASWRGLLRDMKAAVHRDEREQQMLGLATLAAGTAHEMSTPLSTMAVVLGEMRKGAEPPPDWKQNVEVLWRQIQACKRSLAEMVEASDPDHLGRTREISARELLRSVRDRFYLLRPQVPLTVVAKGALPEFHVKGDHTLPQALLNLVNNAADASPHAVELHVSAEDSRLLIEVLDRGPGIAPHLREQLGHAVVSTKGRGSGRGMGLIVSNAAIERAGGRIMLFERKQGGTRVQIELPAYRESA